MKHTIKKGSVGRALIPYRFTRPENVITIRYKKIRETKNSKQIIKLLEEGRNYEQIADELQIPKVDVLTIHQQNTLRYGSGMTKVNLNDMIEKGVTTYEIAQFFKCEESKIVAILNNIDYIDKPNIERNINLAIKVRNLVDKNINFEVISRKLNRNRYYLFMLYNRYFKKFNNEIIDMEIIQKLVLIGLNNDDIAKFYEVPKEHITELRRISVEMKKNKSIPKVSKNINKDKANNCIDEAYEKSNKQDFYDLKMKNR